MPKKPGINKKMKEILDERKKKLLQSKNIMTARKIGKNLQWEKLFFFTIIADILFGYCVLY